MLPPGIAFPEVGFWALHVIAVVLVFVWGYRKGREDERRERDEGDPKR